MTLLLWLYWSRHYLNSFPLVLGYQMRRSYFAISWRITSMNYFYPMQHKLFLSTVDSTQSSWADSDYWLLSFFSLPYVWMETWQIFLWFSNKVFSQTTMKRVDWNAIITVVIVDCWYFLIKQRNGAIWNQGNFGWKEKAKLKDQICS